MDFGHRFVHVPDIPNDFESFGQRYNGRLAFDDPEQVIGYQPGDEVVTALTCLGQKVEVPDVEEVESSGCVAQWDVLTIQACRWGARADAGVQ